MKEGEKRMAPTLLQEFYLLASKHHLTESGEHFFCQQICSSSYKLHKKSEGFYSMWVSFILHLVSIEN